MMIQDMVVLGASGDLAARYLLPAVARLHAAGLLDERQTILGIDRDARDDEEFRAAARARLARKAPDLSVRDVQGVTDRLRHRSADVTDPAQLSAALGDLTGPAAVYLALPNTVFGGAVRALAASGLPAGSRLIVEKPFGADLADARQLNATIHRSFAEDDVFRVDHFLAKQTVLNVLGLRFANRVFEPVWNALHIAAVDIVWDENVALKGRAGYYDGAGALKDMTQNHLLQLLALVAMEPPTSTGHRDLRDRKIDALRAVRPPAPDRMGALTRRARYTAGHLDGRAVPAYVDEPGVDPRRDTETFAEMTVFVDNWRWAGVPFRLRTGKALGRARREIVVRFRPVPHQPFPDTAPANRLRMRLDPDTISLDINLNGSGDPFCLERVHLNARFPAQQLPPYAHVLLSVLHGDPTLSIRGDEAEEGWRIVEPVLRAWSAGDVPMLTYPAGSDGP
ncbi:glucose-6-phosphate dehydrogenase [Micromonospora coxensis]|uniref:Glucose-6-phosphate 1-dehydrogenase n=1 Tax=Micromonospora coxensis TaxID=356852 RepID=A0A1C5H063_9ACTN|nr:glucose-6-phosphate dehydrogenase [Micromonospora coxensis]SCG39425.1 glucose-6-phosphate 1-dehydrogenase [Micromonospora coxensis]